MALNTSKCNHRTPLCFEGLINSDIFALSYILTIILIVKCSKHSKYCKKIKKKKLNNKIHNNIRHKIGNSYCICLIIYSYLWTVNLNKFESMNSEAYLLIYSNHFLANWQHVIGIISSETSTKLCVIVR